MSRRMEQRWPDDTLPHSHAHDKVKLVACETHPAVGTREKKKKKKLGR